MDPVGCLDNEQLQSLLVGLRAAGWTGRCDGNTIQYYIILYHTPDIIPLKLLINIAPLLLLKTGSLTTSVLIRFTNFHFHQISKLIVFSLISGKINENFCKIKSVLYHKTSSGATKPKLLNNG